VSVVLLRDKLIGLPAWQWITGLDGIAAALEVAATVVRHSARRSPFLEFAICRARLLLSIAHI
jgi:hypothetical protein